MTVARRRHVRDSDETSAAVGSATTMQSRSSSGRLPNRSTEGGGPAGVPVRPPAGTATGRGGGSVHDRLGRVGTGGIVGRRARSWVVQEECDRDKWELTCGWLTGEGEERGQTSDGWMCNNKQVRARLLTSTLQCIYLV